MQIFVRFFVALAVCSQASTFAGEPVSFETAYGNAKQTGRPIIAVLGAKWCPGCVVLKKQTIPAALRQGGLRDVEVTHVDVDKQKAIAAKLQQGTLIPQVVRMTWNGEKWDIKRYDGVPNVTTVQEFAKVVKKSTDTISQNTKLIASVQ